MKRAMAMVGLAVGLLGCGSRTGLRVVEEDTPVVDDVLPPMDTVDVVDVPDVMDVLDVPDVPDVQDRPDVCMSRSIVLAYPTADVLLLLDRSTSMNEGIMPPVRTPSRWSTLRAALAATLPQYAASITLGLAFFPSGSQGADMFCSMDAAVAVPFASRNAAAVLARFDATSPNGRTPTFAGLQMARETLRARRAPGRSQNVLLATDGAPNCNTALNGNTCTCTKLGAPMQSSCIGEPSLCLDDTRTVGAVDALARDGVTTYVIGLDGDQTPYLVATLNRLARAGGRPNAGERAYYSARSPMELASALEQAGRNVAACTLEAERRGREGFTLTLELDGQRFPRDTSHREGWDWASPTGNTVAVYGSACEVLRESPPRTPIFNEACPGG